MEKQKIKRAPNGILFLAYTLKEPQVFECNTDNNDGRSDRILQVTLPAGTKVQINLSAASYGNHAEMVHYLEPFTYRLKLDTSYADSMVAKLNGTFPNQR